MEPPPYHGGDVLKYQHIDEDICGMCLGMGNETLAGVGGAGSGGTGGGGGGGDSSVSGIVASSSSSSACADSRTAMFTHVSHLGSEAWGRSLLLFHRCHRISVPISEKQGRNDEREQLGRTDGNSKKRKGVI